MALMEMKDGQPVPLPKFTSDTPTGLSMTTIHGGPERYPPDHQQPCEPWLFVFSTRPENYIVPEPQNWDEWQLCLLQDGNEGRCWIENFLHRNKDKIDP